MSTVNESKSRPQVVREENDSEQTARRRARAALTELEIAQTALRRAADHLAGVTGARRAQAGVTRLHRVVGAARDRVVRLFDRPLRMDAAAARGEGLRRIAQGFEQTAVRIAAIGGR